MDEPRPHRLRRPVLQIIGSIGVILAVTPIILGAEGGLWPASHVTGGILALFALVSSGLRLRKFERILAATAFVISVIVISVVTSGGRLGTAVQIVVLSILGIIYFAVVFAPTSRLANRCP